MQHFEKFDEELAHGLVFILRLLRFFLYASGVLLVALLPGIAGFHLLVGLPLAEAALNALSILGGLGPSSAGGPALAWFAACYGLFADTLFLVAVGILLSPLLHRMLHRWHLAR
ncbi:hypothetical protein I0D00_20530 [Pseudomonas lalucatii]|uniref:Uncharacterized protein n=1 Tax=Pseudomonas lalucatii TaxID=1424203 RepID=A0ABS5Q687_9PSED|nr:hypothetical protein [Pseudomonas lalucatii]MBS7664300.1 hypothetical protein [Pseudomonas lalucatii]MBS7690972.1 hypothetical protein [Pseudomonas lalucatii]MBS7725539.1 hypothetical protein [Pseudomonas lalucatii]QVM86518.1 hypothetical protein I0D68_11390 [Pseudomonas lalucatii]